MQLLCMQRGERRQKRTRTTARGEQAIIPNSIEELARVRAAKLLRDKGSETKAIIKEAKKALRELMGSLKKQGKAAEKALKHCEAATTKGVVVVATTATAKGAANASLTSHTFVERILQIKQHQEKLLLQMRRSSQQPRSAHQIWSLLSRSCTMCSRLLPEWALTRLRASWRMMGSMTPRRSWRGGSN